MEVELPRTFPFRDVFADFLADYASCATYWYVPKTRAVNDENIRAICGILETVFERFLDRVFDLETQDELLSCLIAKGILEPYEQRATRQDRTALTRIVKKLLEVLGLLWIEPGQAIVITDAGLEAIIEEDPRQVIEEQIAKIQYPNPAITARYANDFLGLLPHLFLLQLLRETDYYLTVEEYDLFVNLAQGQEDVAKISRYVAYWRDLSAEEQSLVVRLARAIPMRGDQSATRHDRIHKSSPYQRSLYAYPHYLDQYQDESGRGIICRSPEQVDELVSERLGGLKITSFETLEDWFAYFGDPKQQPSWYTYLLLAIESASTKQEAQELLEQHRYRLTPDEARRVQRSQIEKGIETFYAESLEMLEKGLRLVRGGRQYSTPIGRIDLLCTSANGEYVVVEIKAEEATDSVFGQILRYMGWVHRNLEDARNNVRGIILAGRFPETARYSRIGLLKDNYRQFLKFREHGLDLQTA